MLQPLDCFTCFIGKTTRKKVKEIQNNQEQKPQSKRFFKKGVVGYATRSRFTFFCLFGEKCQYIFFIFLDCDIHRIAAVKKKLDYNNITGVYMFRRLSCRFYVGYFDLKFYFIDLFYHSVCFETCIARKKFYFEKSLEIKILRFCLKFMSRLNSSFFMLLLNFKRI